MYWNKGVGGKNIFCRKIAFFPFCLFSGLLMGMIMFCGGIDNNDEESDSCWQLSSDSFSWSRTIPLPQAVAYAASVCVSNFMSKISPWQFQTVQKNKFYVIGGMYRRDYYGIVQVFDGVQWTLEVPST